MMKKRLCAIILASLFVLAILAGCSGQKQPGNNNENNNQQQQDGGDEKKTDFPTKNINFTVGFAAGHTSDVAGRMLCNVTEPFLGQTIVVNNMDGAGGALGLQHVANQDPDGYNLSFLSDSLNVAHYKGNMETTYKDFRPICMVTTEEMFIHVKADAPWDTFEEFVADAKANPGKITIGNGGIGTLTQLAAQQIQETTGAEFQHVPLSGSDLYIAPINGQVDAICTSLFNALPHIEEGKLKTLVSTGEERSKFLDNPPPTMMELGYDMTIQKYAGVGAPAGTPDEVVEILENAFKQGVESDKYKEFCEKNAIVIDWKGAEEFEKFIAEKDKMIAQLMGVDPVQ